MVVRWRTPLKSDIFVSPSWSSACELQKKKKAETREWENSRVTNWETRNWVIGESQSATCEQWPSWWTTTKRSPSPTWSSSGSARSGRRGAKRRRLRRRQRGIYRARAADNWSAPSPDPKRCRPSRDRFCRLAGGSGSTLPIAFTSLVRRRFELFMFLRFYHFRLKIWFFLAIKVRILTFGLCSQCFLIIIQSHFSFSVSLFAAN